MQWITTSGGVSSSCWGHGGIEGGFMERVLPLLIKYIKALGGAKI